MVAYSVMITDRDITKLEEIFITKMDRFLGNIETV